MSKDSWRFDPNEDYRNYDEDDNEYLNGRNRRGFQPIKKGKKFHKDKLDGKRRNNRDDEGRW